MPTLAPRLILDDEGAKDEPGVGVGLVMLVGVMEKREPCRETVWPAAGCCWHAPLSAVITLGIVSLVSRIYLTVETYSSRDRTGWFGLRDMHCTLGWRLR